MIANDEASHVLTDLQIEALRTGLRDLRETFTVLAVGLTGSHAVGLDTSMSDIDFIAFVSAKGLTRKGGYSERDYFAGGLTCDIQIVTDDELTSWVANLNQTRVAKFGRKSTFELRRTIRNLIRVTMAKPVSSVERFIEMRELVSRDTLCPTTVLMHSVDAQVLLRWTVRLMVDGHHLAALETSGRALRAAGEALLASVDDLNYSPKFLAERLILRDDLDGYPERLVNLLNRPYLSGTDVIQERVELVCHAINFANDTSGTELDLTAELEWARNLVHQSGAAP